MNKLIHAEAFTEDQLGRTDYILMKWSQKHVIIENITLKERGI